MSIKFQHTETNDDVNRSVRVTVTDETIVLEAYDGNDIVGSFCLGWGDWYEYISTRYRPSGLLGAPPFAPTAPPAETRIWIDAESGTYGDASTLRIAWADTTTLEEWAEGVSDSEIAHYGLSQGIPI